MNPPAVLMCFSCMALKALEIPEPGAPQRDGLRPEEHDELRGNGGGC